MIYEEKTMKSEMIYEGRILNLRVDTVELPDRKYSKREIVEHGKAVAIIPIKGDSIVFIQQYRIAVNKVMLEIPAGLLEVNEEPREAALRELQEEIGYSANNLEYLMDSYSSPGFTNERVSIFLATDLYESKLEADDDEFIEVKEIKIKDALKMVENGEILDSKTIVGILYASMKLQ